MKGVRGQEKAKGKSKKGEGKGRPRGGCWPSLPFLLLPFAFPRPLAPDPSIGTVVARSLRGSCGSRRGRKAGGCPGSQPVAIRFGTSARGLAPREKSSQAIGT